MRTLLVAAGVHPLTADDGSVTAPRALLIDGDRITWLGADSANAPPHDRVVDLDSGWVSPAFVDAHVHATGTGHVLSGVDLAGTRSLADCLDRLRDHAGEHPDVPVILGGGWDDFGWPEARPPTAQEVAVAAPGRTVLLLRVDAHSCIVDPGTLAALPVDQLEGVDRDAGGAPAGWLREQASEAAQRHVRDSIPEAQAQAAREVACQHAARLGIVSLHEMGHPGLSTLDDARAWAGGSWPIEVITWWAALDPDEGPAHGLRPGGDLFLDGSIGSQTAAVSCGYTDGGHGELFHPDEAVAAFFTGCSRAGRGAGVHAIGDRAIEQAITAIEAAARAVGADAVRACRHRVEHVVLPSLDQVRRMADLGVVASVQPAFDATWGGAEGLYAARFGTALTRTANPFAWFVAAGVPLAFSSDAPVTPMDPWGSVAAAERHLSGLGIDRRTALAAHTIGGRYVAGQDDVGSLSPGMRADLAVWDADPFGTDDPRGLRCVFALRAGTPTFRSAVWP
jgi:predicted amidohydrolase YtcJ